MTIITGLYLVLWGKRKDKLLVKSDSDGKQQMTETDEASKRTVQPSQEFISLDVTRETK